MYLASAYTHTYILLQCLIPITIVRTTSALDPLRLPISGDLFLVLRGGDGTVVESPLRGHPTNSMSCDSVYSPATKPHTILQSNNATHPYASIRLITTSIFVVIY